MKRMLKVIGVAVAVGAAAVVGAWTTTVGAAEEADLTRFAPPGSKAVVSLELKRLQDANQLGPIIKKFLNTDEMEKAAKALAFFIGSDIRSDLHTLFMASTGTDKPSELAVVQGVLNINRLEELLLLNDKTVKEAYRNVALFKVPDEAKKRIVAVAFLSDTLLVAGSEDAVQRAINIQAGDKPDGDVSEAVAAFRQMPAGAALRVAVVQAQDLPGEKDPVQKQLENVFIHVVPNGGLELSVQARAKTAEAASQIKEVLEGYLALAKLATAAEKKPNEDVIKALNEAQIAVSERTLNCKMRLPAGVFLEELERKHSEKSAP